jgi:hypothetical protein
MQAKEFLSTVIGGGGYVCVFGANPAKKRVIQKLYPTIDDACAAAANLQKEGFDAYFGLATFIDDKSRRADNAGHLKSFFLDIDCGPEKDASEGYPGGQGDGLAALRKFVSIVGLPDPLIVSSGRGLHVYWPLAEPITPQEWLPAAERLKALCVTHGLVADPAVTADVARVLRVPGTLNFKDSPPKPVEIISEPPEPLMFSEFKTTIGATKPASTNATFFSPLSSVEDDVTNALLGNYINVFKNILVKTVAGRGCAQLHQIIAEQETTSEPMWRGGLSIAKFCTDCDKAAHRISARHPSYSPEETRQKLDQIKGPYTCDTFDKLNPGVCDKCPNKGKIKSPIVLGREVQEAQDEVVVEDVPVAAPGAKKQTYVIPKYPAPFFRGVNGGVFKRMKDKQGDPIEYSVYHNDLYVTRRLHDPEVGESAVIRLHLPKDGVREFTMPLASMLSRDDFRKYMAMNGVAVLKMDDLMAYTTTWVNKLQAEIEADTARRQFGWTSDEMESFVVGGQEIRADRVDINPPSNATVRMMPAFDSKGTVDSWVKMAEFYNRPGMEMHQYVIGLSFGSPLVAFSPEGAALLHLYSKESGVGKTTAMKVGNSIWGHPSEMMCQERDTYNSKMNRAEVYKNVFLTMDELSNMIPKDASDFVYQLTGYKQRNRMSNSSNGERLRGDPWKSGICSSGNTSLIARIMMYKNMPKAEMVRILEIPAEAYPFEQKIETDVFTRMLEESYGTVCVPYMQCVILKREEIKNLFLLIQKKIDEAAELSQPHRFWSTQAAAAITGLTIAKRLKLVNYDIPAVFKYAVEQINRNKALLAADHSDPESILASFLAENYNNILRIRSTDDSRVGNVEDTYIVPDSAPRLQLVARFEYDLKMLYVMPKAFREWCGKSQLPYNEILNGLKKGRTAAFMKKVRMGKGTRMNLPPTSVLVINCSEFSIDDEPEGEA